MQLTHLGGPTVLIELAGWRILTDPTFDPPGRRYTFGWGTSSRKLSGPTTPVGRLPAADLVLLSHDHHADNLDEMGRRTLAGATTIVTTGPAGRRLTGPDVRGLDDWSSTVVRAPGRPDLTVTATPCRHGPKFSRPIAGKVNGFGLRIEGEDRTALWMSGDTVLYDGVRGVGDRMNIDVALLHLGGVRFPITGSIRYSMTGQDAITLISALTPRLAVPVHYEGWSHFAEPESVLRRVLDDAPAHVAPRVLWLTRGLATAVPSTER